MYTVAVDAVLSSKQRVLFEVFDAFARDAFGVASVGLYSEPVRVMDISGWFKVLDVTGLRSVRCPHFDRPVNCLFTCSCCNWFYWFYCCYCYCYCCCYCCNC